MGLLEGSLSTRVGVPENSPLTFMGRFPLLNGSFSDLDGPFPRMPYFAVFSLENPIGEL